MRRTLTILALVLPTAHAARGWAGGAYQINSQSAWSAGQADATVARVSTPEAMFYNPAGIAGIRGFAFTGGITFAQLAMTYDDVNPSGAQPANYEGVGPIPNLYAAWGISDRLTLGVGMFAPYGLGGDWTDGWAGRQRLQKAALRAMYFQPTLGWRLTDNLHVGIGVALVAGQMVMEQKIGLAEDTNPELSAGDIEATAEFTGHTLTVAPAIGVIYRPLRDFSVGLRYRMGVEPDFEGQVDFRDVPREFQAMLVDQDATMRDMPMPHAIQAGVAYNLGWLSAEADVNFTTWSQLDRLKLEFDDDALDNELKFDCKDTFSYHLGVEARLDRWVDRLRVRAGAAYETTPFPTETIHPFVPDTGSVNVALGSSYQFGSWDLSAAFVRRAFLEGDSKLATLQARYGGRIDFFGLSATYQR